MIEVTKHGLREFAVIEDGNLLAVCAYRKGAVAVKERLEMLQTSLRELAAKVGAREPLVWEECFDSPKLKNSVDGNEWPPHEDGGRASEGGVEQHSQRRLQPRREKIPSAKGGQSPTTHLGGSRGGLPRA